MIPNDRPYIIGETAFHHQGDINYLKALIDAAAEIGVDAIKFHVTIDLSDYFVAAHPAFSAVSEWIFTESQWAEIFAYASNKGLEIVALCNDVAAMDWVNTKCSTPVRAVEIHATGINDVFLLSAAAKSPATVMLGVGGSTLEHVQFAIEYLNANAKSDIFLMYGFQNYPTDYKDINFSKIKIFQDIFKLPVGYADHTDPDDQYNELITTSALLKGVNVLEKHFTLDVTEKRIDSQAAVSVDQMKKIVTLSQVMWTANGTGSLEMSVAEKKYGDIGPMKKAIVARRPIPKGKIIEASDLAYKRTENSSYIEQKSLDALLGAKALDNIETDATINYSNVEYKFKLAELGQFTHNK